MNDLYKMNPEVKALWTTALRSGDYIQAVGALRTIFEGDQPDGFCCFGVLCDLAAKAGVIHSDEEQMRALVKGKGGTSVVNVSYFPEGKSAHDIEASASLAPEEVLKWAGLVTPYGVTTYAENFANRWPQVLGEVQAADLVTLNDHNASFEMIADVIDRYL